MKDCVPNDLAVDSAGDAVLQLEVHLGDGVLGEDGGLGDITYRLDNSLDGVLLHYSRVFRGQGQRKPPKSSEVVYGFEVSQLVIDSAWVECCEGHIRMAADSTMLRMVKRLMALSLGTQRAQLEQRTGLTWPRPFLLRPLKNQSVIVFPMGFVHVQVVRCIHSFPHSPSSGNARFFVSCSAELCSIWSVIGE